MPEGVELPRDHVEGDETVVSIGVGGCRVVPRVRSARKVTVELSCLSTVKDDDLALLDDEALDSELREDGAQHAEVELDVVVPRA